MFNSSLKKEALKIHEETLGRYNESVSKMSKSCECLYNERLNSIKIINEVESVINTIASKPKEFEKKMGDVSTELSKFKNTETYAKEAYDDSIKAGVNIIGGAAAGLGIASMAPTALMSIATTFGTASTGTAISALSGAAAQKAAVAWLGRTFAKFAVTEGAAGMAAGEAFLALAGPIGWGITAASTGLSLISLTNSNKETADKAVEEAKNIEKARESLDETTQKINALESKTKSMNEDIREKESKINNFREADYLQLEEEEKLFLGTIVNNMYSISELLNKTIK